MVSVKTQFLFHNWFIGICKHVCRFGLIYIHFCFSPQILLLSAHSPAQVRAPLQPGSPLWTMTKPLESLLIFWSPWSTAGTSSSSAEPLLKAWPISGWALLVEWKHVVQFVLMTIICCLINWHLWNTTVNFTVSFPFCIECPISWEWFWGRERVGYWFN